jgi:hypothetical protein
MPLPLTGHEIAVRLALSVVAGALIGLDRGERGRPAPHNAISVFGVRRRHDSNQLVAGHKGKNPGFLHHDGPRCVCHRAS